VRPDGREAVGLCAPDAVDDDVERPDRVWPDPHIEEDTDFNQVGVAVGCSWRRE
jgi:hypothetical protein